MSQQIKTASHDHTGALSQWSSLLEKRGGISLNPEQESSLDMFPEVECDFIQHESILLNCRSAASMSTATIHSWKLLSIRDPKQILSDSLSLAILEKSSNTGSPWHWSSSERQRARWPELRQSNAYSTKSLVQWVKTKQNAWAQILSEIGFNQSLVEIQWVRVTCDENETRVVTTGQICIHLWNQKSIMRVNLSRHTSTRVLDQKKSIKCCQREGLTKQLFLQ